MNQTSVYLLVPVFSKFVCYSRFVLIAILFYSYPAYSETPYNNYLLNCMGCHGEDGRGLEKEGVPNMQGVIGNFLMIPGGREYLVQVPGSVQAPISDLELAQLLNYIINRFAGSSKPPEFQPYTKAEVNNYRRVQLIDVIGTRNKLINKLHTIDVIGLTVD